MDATTFGSHTCHFVVKKCYPVLLAGKDIAMCGRPAFLIFAGVQLLERGYAPGWRGHFKLVAQYNTVLHFKEVSLALLE